MRQINATFPLQLDSKSTTTNKTCMGRLPYNTIQYKTCNAPYVTKMLFVGAGMTRD